MQNVTIEFIISAGLFILSGFLLIGWPLYVLTIFRYSDHVSAKNASINAALGIGLGFLVGEIAFGINIFGAFCISGITTLVAILIFRGMLLKK